MVELQPQLRAYMDDANERIKDVLSKELGALPGYCSAFAEAMEYKRSVEARGVEGIVKPPKRIDESQIVSVQDLKSAVQAHFKQSPVALIKQSHLNPQARSALSQLGYQAIAAGKVGCLMLAGGQGTRLGFEGPKGCFRVGTPSNYSLFEYFFRRAMKLRSLVAENHKMEKLPSLYMYVMVSKGNEAATRSFLEENMYFGYEQDQVLLFQQTTMPSFDLNGNVLLAGPARLTENPNGNGGVFESLHRTKTIDHMKRNNVKYIHTFGVDNLLTRIADPEFLGACVAANVPVGNKCCSKVDPREKVGVQVELCQAEGERGVPSVVEYTEISKDMAEQRVEGGSELLYSAANICNHFFTTKFLDELITEKLMKYHVAVKQLPCYDITRLPPKGVQIEANSMIKKVEGVKLEYFIFDAFKASDCLLVYEGDREREFSPVKNVSGSDSPATAKSDLLKLHKKWLLKAEAIIEADEEFEVLPRLSYDGEGLDVKGVSPSNINGILAVQRVAKPI